MSRKPPAPTGSVSLEVVPVEYIECDGPWDRETVLSICALYLSGKGINRIARELHRSKSTVIAVVRASKVEGLEMPIWVLKHMTEKMEAAEAQWGAQMAAWRAMRGAARKADYKGMQKAGYGARQAAEAWLDYTEGRKGGGEAEFEEAIFTSKRRVKRG